MAKWSVPVQSSGIEETQMRNTASHQWVACSKNALLFREKFFEKTLKNFQGVKQRDKSTRVKTQLKKRDSYMKPHPFESPDKLQQTGMPELATSASRKACGNLRPNPYCVVQDWKTADTRVQT
mmetsp:Transcript_3407/g.6518  ORF Transcript_3407/g.6518 Transcript_3407/m.6518 type:complete len:123 (-) Transcript_3407:852-1220(-)